MVAVDPRKIAEQAQLRYISDDTPGFQRLRWGRGFTYRDTEGETIRDDDLREWIESIVIPPAWTDVWISPYKNGHILATGRDEAGRKQYRYHPRWVEYRNCHKFDRMAMFGQQLPQIRKITDAHLRKRALTRKKILAIIVRLLETTLIRIGNIEYARHNHTYGLTTLHDDHVEFYGQGMCFTFTGKSGKAHTVDVKDRALARVVKASQDIPGYELFQYYDQDGERHPVDSSEVNDYLHQISGDDFTAKDFRTWGGSVAAVRALCSLPTCDTDDERDQNVVEAVKQVAADLGNTPAVCRQYYIHPAVIEAYLQDELNAVIDRQPDPEDAHALDRHERALIELITTD